jgi:hypothetical protein
MAAMSTALTEFADNGNSRTYTTSGHTASLPKLVIQKRRVPEGSATVAESTVSVIHATQDEAGDVLSQKVTMSVSVRYPIDGNSNDVDAVLVILRDIVAGDEFANTVDTQEWLS